MFTGIVEELGTVLDLQKGAKSASLTILGETVCDGLSLGDSVAVNGVCLTARALTGDAFTADVMHETLSRSTLGALRRGRRVNLERAMALGGRLGGHIVSGHIDGVGVITKIARDDNAVWFTIRADTRITRYIVEKGSVALDGISLTAARTDANVFSVSVIPHTLEHTILQDKKLGDCINIECDVIGKYVEKMMTNAPAQPGHSGSVTLSLLTETGFM